MHPTVMTIIAVDMAAELQRSVIEGGRTRPRAGRLQRLRLGRRASRITHP